MEMSGSREGRQYRTAIESRTILRLEFGQIFLSLLQ